MFGSKNDQLSCERDAFLLALICGRGYVGNSLSLHKTDASNSCFISHFTIHRIYCLHKKNCQISPVDYLLLVVRVRYWFLFYFFTLFLYFAIFYKPEICIKSNKYHMYRIRFYLPFPFLFFI